jgi:hypothetical protein
MQQLNETLPAGAKVVFLWEPRTYFCRPDCQPDSLLDKFPHLVYQYGSAEKIAQSWQEAGVTHVLLHRSGLEFVLGESPEVVNRAALAELEERYLIPLVDVVGSYQIYRFEPEP